MFCDDWFAFLILLYFSLHFVFVASCLSNLQLQRKFADNSKVHSLTIQVSSICISIIFVNFIFLLPLVGLAFILLTDQESSTAIYFLTLPVFPSLSKGKILYASEENINPLFFVSYFQNLLLTVHVSISRKQILSSSQLTLLLWCVL